MSFGDLHEVDGVDGKRYRYVPTNEQVEELEKEIVRLKHPKRAIDGTVVEGILGLTVAAVGAGAAFSWPYGLMYLGTGLFASALLRILKRAV